MASATLFALLNGDVLHDTFALLSDTHLRAGFWGDVDWFISLVYLYSFLALFIYVVLNVLVALVEDAYFGICQTLAAGARSEGGRDMRLIHPHQLDDMLRLAHQMKRNLGEM